MDGYPYRTLGSLQSVRCVSNDSNKYVSCEFDKFRVDGYLCKLRDTPAARLARHHGCIATKSHDLNHTHLFDGDVILHGDVTSAKHNVEEEQD